MADIEDGESVEVQGSAAKPYVLTNTGGVYACTCPAWRNQSLGIEKRTCKHLRRLRGDAAEDERTGGATPERAARTPDGQAEGEEKAGPPLLLAHTWENDVELTGWWMSEKLDGVRAYWDGSAFVSRLGNRYHAPDWFVEGLPDVPLDGELWGGRKRFQRTISIVRRQDRSHDWKEIAFLVFDAPALKEPFEKRLAFLEERLPAGSHPHARAHEHQVCQGLDHLRSELARVEALGGEGLMLRKPGSRYEVGRSSTLLKVKSFLDAEARVVEHLAGAGRHKGRLGALVVEMADGTRFSVGTGFSDAERSAPPPVGSLVTFRYQELSEAGVPRFPSFVGVRPDVDAPSASLRPGAAPPERRDVAPGPGGPVTRGSASGGSETRARFELVEGGSSKFWEIVVSGSQHTVRFGRIGTAGQEKTKTFPDGAAAARDAESLIAEKTRKGYRKAG